MKNVLTSRLKKKKKGFTLIELIIVIAIIAILAAIAIPRFGAVRRDANISADKSNAKTIQSAVATLIAQDQIAIPTTAENITLDSATTTGDTGTLKTYLQSVPTPKAITGGTFVASIDTNGNVSVSVTSGTGSSVSTVQILPTPGTPYNN